jgi:hypothetical protein
MTYDVSGKCHARHCFDWNCDVNDGMTALLALSVADAAAQSPDTRQFEVTPYLWTTAMRGDVRGGSLPTASVDMSFSDIDRGTFLYDMKNIGLYAGGGIRF